MPGHISPLPKLSREGFLTFLREQASPDWPTRLSCLSLYFPYFLISMGVLTLIQSHCLLAIPCKCQTCPCFRLTAIVLLLSLYPLIYFGLNHHFLQVFVHSDRISSPDHDHPRKRASLCLIHSSTTPPSSAHTLHFSSCIYHHLIL